MSQPQHPVIPVVTGTGTGSTELSAFDAALRAAGAADCNLVRLSSVVPPRTTVDTTGAVPVPTGSWGDRLYCVYAEQCASRPGEQAWAGIGWVQRVDGAGGLFVEHEGTSEHEVADLIDRSLADLAAGRPHEFGPPEQVLTGVTCTDAPVCALVLAAYETAGWESLR